MQDAFLSVKNDLTYIFKEYYDKRFMTNRVCKRWVNKMRWNGKLWLTPNVTTTLRLPMAIIGLLLINQMINLPILWIAIILLSVGMIFLIIAAWMDSLDGYIARVFELGTIFGKYYDPFIDKVTNGLCAADLVYLHSQHELSFLYLPSLLILFTLEAALFFSALIKYKIAHGTGFLNRYFRTEAEGANLYGKIKMPVESITLLLDLLLIKFIDATAILACLYLVAALFAALSIVAHARTIKLK
jgi:CDP-diacylglycerol--glycerol-3-phosphate 3-phosphatidyltransferase